MKKLRCDHRYPIEDDEESVTSGRGRKAARRTPSLTQTINVSEAPNTNGDTSEHPAATAEHAMRNRAQSIETIASQRPCRLGAGKRKLSEIIEEIPAPKRTRRAPATAPTDEMFQQQQQPQLQNQQRKKSSSKGHKEIDSSAVVIPDTPDNSLSPVERSSPSPRDMMSSTDGNMGTSIDLAWHRYMSGAHEKYVKDTEQKYKRWRRTVELADAQFEDFQRSMKTTQDFMNEWISRFTRQTARLQ